MGYVLIPPAPLYPCWSWWVMNSNFCLCSTDELLKLWLQALVALLYFLLGFSVSAWERLRNWQMAQGQITASFWAILFVFPSSLSCFGLFGLSSPTWWNCSKPQSTTLCLGMMVQITNTSEGKTSHQCVFSAVFPSFLWKLCSTADCLGCFLMPSLMLSNI